MSHASCPILLIVDSIASEVVTLDLQCQSPGKKTVCAAKLIDPPALTAFIARSGLASKPSRRGLP